MTTALWCILIAGFLPLAAGIFAKASRPNFDNDNPRAWLATLDGAGARAKAAMENGFEGFPLFAAAVIVAHMLKAEQATVDLLAMGYIACRVVFTFVYIKGWGTLRSTVWAAGIACVVGLFVISA